MHPLFLILLICLFGLFDPASEKAERQDCRAEFTGGLGIDDADGAEDGIEQEHERDIEHKIPEQGMEQGMSAVAHGLHAEGGMKVHELHRGGQAAIPQEKGGKADGGHSLCGGCALGAEEDLYDGCGEQLKQDDAHRADHKTVGAANLDGFLHTFPVAGSEVVGDDGHHGLTDADIDGVWQTLGFHDDAHGSQLQVAVTGHQSRQHKVGDIVQTRQQGRGDPDGENFFPQVFADTAEVTEAAAEHGGFGNLSQHEEQEQTGGYIGQAGGQRRAEDLHAVGQQDEHEQWVEDHIQHAAAGQTEARLLGIADIPEQMGDGQGKDCGHGAENDGQHCVLLRKEHGLVRRAKNRQNGCHQDPDEQGIAQRAEDVAVKAESADVFGVLCLPPSAETGNQTAAAHAEEVGDGNGHDEQREGHGDGGHHVGVAGTPDIEGIDDIVNQVDKLADDRGDRHGHNGLGNGHGLK